MLQNDTPLTLLNIIAAYGNSNNYHLNLYEIHMFVNRHLVQNYVKLIQNCNCIVMHVTT